MTTKKKPAPEQAGSIKLEPNFYSMAKAFTDDAVFHGERFLRENPQTLSLFRNFIVSLNIALQSTTNADSVLYLREVIGKLAATTAALDDKHLFAAEEANV
jgi:hypothetical protein